jgi:peptidoglycan hydrolase-like protein with peptidoglycan-binding domain
MERRALLSAAVLAVVLVAAGAAGAMLLSGEPIPADLRAAREVTSAPVGAQRFADERTVQAGLMVSEPMPIGLRARAGTVTASHCVPGQPISSGSPALRIDDVPIIALHTTLPLYRDLGPGDRGRDVASVQAELSRLGYRVGTDGEFGLETAVAVKKLQRDAGYPRPDGQLFLDRVVWLPASTITPTRCDAAPGTVVNAGSTFAGVDGQLGAVQITSLPGDLVPGPRSLTIFGVTGALTRSGSASAPDFLAKVAATPEFRAWLTAKSTEPIPVTIALTKPMLTAKVPPGAIFALAGSRGCVQSRNLTIPVVVVGSGLGASLVTVEGEPPTAVNIGPAITSTGCG